MRLVGEKPLRGRVRLSPLATVSIGSEDGAVVVQCDSDDDRWRCTPTEELRVYLSMTGTPALVSAKIVLDDEGLLDLQLAQSMDLAEAAEDPAWARYLDSMKFWAGLPRSVDDKRPAVLPTALATYIKATAGVDGAREAHYGMCTAYLDRARAGDLGYRTVAESLLSEPCAAVGRPFDLDVRKELLEQLAAWDKEGSSTTRIGNIGALAKAAPEWRGWDAVRTSAVELWAKYRARGERAEADKAFAEWLGSPETAIPASVSEAAARRYAAEVYASNCASLRRDSRDADCVARLTSNPMSWDATKLEGERLRFRGLVTEYLATETTWVTTPDALLQYVEVVAPLFPSPWRTATVAEVKTSAKRNQERVRKEEAARAAQAAAEAAYGSSCERSVKALSKSNKAVFVRLVSSMARDLGRITDAYSIDERCDILSGNLDARGDPSDVVPVNCTWNQICYEYILGE